MKRKKTKKTWRTAKGHVDAHDPDINMVGVVRVAPLTPTRVVAAAFLVAVSLRHGGLVLENFPSETRKPFAVLAGTCAAFLFFIAPIPQDVAYHTFADQRGFCCTCGSFGYTENGGRMTIPNFSDIASNFVIFAGGLCGLLLLMVQHDLNIAGNRWELYVCLPLFFGSMLAVTLGSIYYHWRPSNSTLVFDRLPMTVAFMAIFSFLLDERLSATDSESQLGTLILFPLIIIGASSVVYWHLTDDLRPYALVQFIPLIALPILMACYPPKYTNQEYWLLGLFWYALAKVLESNDSKVYEWTGRRISGHSLKHAVVGFVPVTLAYMCFIRQPLQGQKDANF